MSDLIRAFPWLERLRPLTAWWVPALAAVLFIAGLLSTASYGVLASLALLFCAVGLALVRFSWWICVIPLAVGTALIMVGDVWPGYAWVMADSAIAAAILATRRTGGTRWFALGAAVLQGIAIATRVQWVGVLVPITLLVGAWAVGFAMGEALSRVRAVATADQLTQQLDASTQQLDQTQLQLAVTAERERMAQEVHDVVAHSLAVILAQAEGARALEKKRPAAMAAALDQIAAQSRSALLDVRGIVDGLAGGVEPPQPTLADLPELLHGVEEAGLVVKSTCAGESRELDATQQTAVYRIVQEGATNAIRHRGRGSALDLVLDWRGPGLSIQLVSAGEGDAEPTPGAGRGIPGMTERARVAGGWLAAGADESGDHRITAFLPFREAETGTTATTADATAPAVPA